jgi:hypothetical protein
MIDTTVSSPNLPSHFKASVHDVASAFKKFLAGLPGGILGSLALFDAFVAVYSQVYADPELNRTKQSKLRAHLIALAIGTLKSRYRRELICAVFGLLSLIGHSAEKAPREDEHGKPLPTSDLMGYNALGAVFGPLLVGNLLDFYTMKLANLNDGLILLPMSPPRSRKDRNCRNSKTLDEVHPPSSEVDKIQVASSIAELIITHWREVVQHLKSLGILKARKETTAAEQSQSQSHQKQLRPTASETFDTRQPVGREQPLPASVHTDSPIPWRPSSSGSECLGLPMQAKSRSSLTFPLVPQLVGGHSQSALVHEPLNIKRRRPKSGWATANDLLAGKTSLALLSPTTEEAGSPYLHNTGGSDQPVPSVDASVAVNNHEPSRDPPEILLQTASPIIAADSSTPSAVRRKKASKYGPRGAKKLGSEKGSQHAQRVRRDTPAPTLSRHDSAWTWEEDKTPSAKEPVDTNEHGVQPHIHHDPPDVTVNATNSIGKNKVPSGSTAGFKQESINTRVHIDQHHEHGVQQDATANVVDRQDMQRPGSRPTASLDLGIELEVQTPFIHPGEFPETPAAPEEFPIASYVHPGAFPESPTDENHSGLVQGDKTAAATRGHPSNEVCYPSKPTRGGASSPVDEEGLPTIRADKAPSTLGQSFKATLDEASNSLVRGVSSAASALVEVFNLPSSGATTPTRIPGPQGSLRRNSRPSKHRRVQKRRTLDIFKTPSGNDEPEQPSARDTEGKENQPEPQSPSLPGGDGHASYGRTEDLFSGMNDIRAGLEDLTRNLAVKRKELGIDARPADINQETLRSVDDSMVYGENTAAKISADKDSAEVGVPRPHNNDGHASLLDDPETGPSASYPLRSYFPSIDGNQSSATTNTARDQGNNAVADDQNEKILLNVGGLAHHTMQGGFGVIPDDTDTQVNLDSLRDWPPSGVAQKDGNGPLEAGSSEPQDQGQDHISCKSPNHFVDARPQRSVRRLSHIFKGMRRPSTVATPSSTSARRASHFSSTPSAKHIRRSSTSAASSSQAPTLPDPKLLGPGRMTPYQDLPPVASHLARKLPPRSATPSMETLPTLTATPSGGSNAALYNQVVTLQRQAAARTEEVAHLRRQLDAIGEGGAGTLSERLRVAERDAKMWRDRALAAERRVVVFERFLGRVRQLRRKRAGDGKGGEEEDIEQEIGEEIGEEIEREMEALDGTGKGSGEGIGQSDGVVQVSGEEYLGVWLTAAREVLEYDEERSWMSGSC